MYVNSCYCSFFIIMRFYYIAINQKVKLAHTAHQDGKYCMLERAATGHFVDLTKHITNIQQSIKYILQNITIPSMFELHATVNQFSYPYSLPPFIPLYYLSVFSVFLLRISTLLVYFSLHDNLPPLSPHKNFPTSPSMSFLLLIIFPRIKQVYLLYSMNICEICTLANQPQKIKNSKLPSDHKYYILCKQGHILCGTCITKKGRNQCQIGQNHPTFSTPIQCLKHNKGIPIHEALIKARLRSDNQLTSQLNDLKELQGELKKDPIYDQVTQQTLFMYECQMDQLQTRLDKLQQDINKYQANQRYLHLFFDILASFFCFCSTILITVEVSLLIKTYDYQYIGPYLFVQYYIALAMSFLPFYAVVIPQAYERHQQEIFEFRLVLLFMLVVNVLYLFVAVIISVPINTLEVIRGKPFEKAYLIPKQVPLGWKIDYGLPFMKSIVFWMILIIRQSAFKNTYQLITLICSFLEAISLVYLTIRQNYNETLLKQLPKNDQ